MRPVIWFFICVVLSPWDYVMSTRLMENRYLGLFQGDIMIRNRSHHLDRNAMTNREGRWPGGEVVYEIEDTYSDSDREIIKSAIEEFEKLTCIRWIERTDEDIYVSIENDMGCWSELGRIGGVQSLSLQAPACMKKGVIMHEMMHTLGFLHEQSRPDRDNYVQVVWDNIVGGMEPNFEKMSPEEMDDLELDYDYSSIMHYTAYMFASDRSQPTLIPKNSDVSLKELGYGQVKPGFTDLDLQKLNKFYECPSK